MRMLWTFLLVALFAVSLCAQIKRPDPPAVKVPFEKSLQAVVVTTKGWDTITGTAALYERKSANSHDWKRVGESFKVGMCDCSHGAEHLT